MSKEFLKQTETNSNTPHPKGIIHSMDLVSKQILLSLGRLYFFRNSVSSNAIYRKSIIATIVFNLQLIYFKNIETLAFTYTISIGELPVKQCF